MSKTSGGYESSGGCKMKDTSGGFESNGGPKMPHTAGGYESAPNNPVYGREKGSRYPKGKAQQDSYFKEEAM